MHFPKFISIKWLKYSPLLLRFSCSKTLDSLLLFEDLALLSWSDFANWQLSGVFVVQLQEASPGGIVRLCSPSRRSQLRTRSALQESRSLKRSVGRVVLTEIKPLRTKLLRGFGAAKAKKKKKRQTSHSLFSFSHFFFFNNPSKNIIRYFFSKNQTKMLLMGQVTCGWSRPPHTPHPTPGADRLQTAGWFSVALK